MNTTGAKMLKMPPLRTVSQCKQDEFDFVVPPHHTNITSLRARAVSATLTQNYRRTMDSDDTQSGP